MEYKKNDLNIIQKILKTLSFILLILLICTCIFMSFCIIFEFLTGTEMLRQSFQAGIIALIIILIYLFIDLIKNEIN